jgi:hypothetical protein
VADNRRELRACDRLNISDPYPDGDCCHLQTTAERATTWNLFLNLIRWVISEYQLTETSCCLKWYDFQFVTWCKLDGLLPRVAGLRSFSRRRHAFLEQLTPPNTTARRSTTIQPVIWNESHKTKSGSYCRKLLANYYWNRWHAPCWQLTPLNDEEQSVSSDSTWQTIVASYEHVIF